MSEKDDAVQHYFSEVAAHGLLTAEEEIYYGRLALQGDKKAKKHIIESNLRLVIKIARQYCHRGLELADLIEEGNLGLIHAVDKFDPEKGFRFSTYAVWWIREAIEQGLINKARLVRLPVHVAKALNRCLKAVHALSQTTLEVPKPEAIAKKTHQSLPQTTRVLNYQYPVISLDKPLNERTEKTKFDKLFNEQENIAVLFMKQDLYHHIQQWLNQLSVLQKEIIEKRFGLNSYDPHTLEAVGDEKGLGRERIRQIQNDALKILRHALEAEGLTRDIIFAPE